MEEVGIYVGAEVWASKFRILISSGKMDGEIISVDK